MADFFYLFIPGQEYRIIPSMKRKRSLLLIGIGVGLFLLAGVGALFPFVPIIFSDAKFLSDRVETENDLGDEASVSLEPEETVSATGTATSVVLTTPIQPSPTQRPKLQNENVLVIDKIGVSVPIVEGKDAGAMLYGAWRYPGTSKPNKGSNTVIFGHRFRYLPPNNTTFYSLNKLAAGDTFSARWQGKVYHYKVTETKTIQPNDFSVVQPTEKSTITLITCTPLFTTNERLVVVGELVP